MDRRLTRAAATATVGFVVGVIIGLVCASRSASWTAIADSTNSAAAKGSAAQWGLYELIGWGIAIFSGAPAVALWPAAWFSR